VARRRQRTKAATEHTKNQRRTHEGNATVLRVQQTKQSKIKETKFIYIGEEERELEETYKGTKAKSMKLQEEMNSKGKCRQE